MHVESVARVMGRKDLLSRASFCIDAALCWIRSIEGAGGDWPESRAPPEFRLGEPVEVCPDESVSVPNRVVAENRPL